MTTRYIWIKGKRLYLHSSYTTWKEAKKHAKYYQKKYKNNYFILPTESFITGGKRFNLFMNKVVSL